MIVPLFLLGLAPITVYFVISWVVGPAQRYAALRGAQRDWGLFKCAVSFAAVSDLTSMRRYDGQFLDGNSAKNYWKEQTPDLDAVSPLKHAAEFSTPTLIIHGKTDLRVPVEQSRDMAQKLRSAGKIHRYVEQSKGDHHFSRQADRLEFLTEMQAWLDKYNPVDLK
jgi:dipeptidyl aminopeptidase/acylaminoacyl peptidase